MQRRQFLRQTAALSGLTLAGGVAVWAAPATTKLTWQTDLREAHTLAVEQDRPILVVFSAKWCTYCHKLIREVGADKKLAAFVSANFVPTQLDFDKEKRIAEVLEVESLPTTIILTPKVDLLQRKAGYMKIDVFRKWLDEGLVKQAEIRQVNGTLAP